MAKSELKPDEQAVYGALSRDEWRDRWDVSDRTDGIPMADIEDILMRLVRTDIIRNDGQRVPTGWRLPREWPPEPPIAGVVRSQWSPGKLW